MPIPDQFHTLKRQHPDHLLIFRQGDLYELYGADALQFARVPGVKRTHRIILGDMVMTIGFLRDDLEHHLAAIVAAGLRAAVLEQVPPGAVKGRKVELVVMEGDL